LSATATSFGRYRLEEVLGHGGMALVYRAWDKELERPVAIKVIADNLAREESLRRRFLREAMTVASLAHPNVVKVYDTGELDSRLFIVMEYVEGETLAEVLLRRGALRPAEATQLALQICAGLAHAHARGIVHRDVKPQNLLVQPDGSLKIADFGIAKPEGATTLTETGGIVGTAAYLAPEQLAGEEATPRSDVYSLAAVLYEMLTGRPPREVATLTQLIRRNADEPVAAVRELVPHVPRALESVVMRGLAATPRYRPASAAEVAQALEPGSEVGTVRFPRRKTRARWLVLVPSALVLLLALGLWLGLSGSNQATHPAPAPHIAKLPATQARELSDWLRANPR
jgi:eukaryotic-like serine/threonine-protein kinase